MPRGKRILLNNVYYHIINRGNQRMNIFSDCSDFERYLALLKHYKHKYSCDLFGYCLMPNHIHLILLPKQLCHLPAIMQRITQSYTWWFNKKYNKVGRLWQGRFKSMVIEKDDYFLECVYYIEKNPVRAGIVSNPGDYPWSSYRDRTLGNNKGLLDFPDST